MRLIISFVVIATVCFGQVEVSDYYDSFFTGDGLSTYCKNEAEQTYIFCMEAAGKERECRREANRNYLDCMNTGSSSCRQLSPCSGSDAAENEKYLDSGCVELICTVPPVHGSRKYKHPENDPKTVDARIPLPPGTKEFKVGSFMSDSTGCRGSSGWDDCPKNAGDCAIAWAKIRRLSENNTEVFYRFYNWSHCATRLSKLVVWHTKKRFVLKSDFYKPCQDIFIEIFERLPLEQEVEEAKEIALARPDWKFVLSEKLHKIEEDRAEAEVTKQIALVPKGYSDLEALVSEFTILFDEFYTRYCSDWGYVVLFDQICFFKKSDQNALLGLPADFQSNTLSSFVTKQLDGHECKSKAESLMLELRIKHGFNQYICPFSDVERTDLELKMQELISRFNSLLREKYLKPIYAATLALEPLDKNRSKYHELEEVIKKRSDEIPRFQSEIERWNAYRNELNNMWRFIQDSLDREIDAKRSKQVVAPKALKKSPSDIFKGRFLRNINTGRDFN